MNLLTRALVLAPLAVYVNFAVAGNVALRAGVGTGDYNITFENCQTSSKCNSLKADADYQPIQIGATYIFNSRDYLDLSYSSSSGNSIEQAPSQELDRTDITLTYGQARPSFNSYFGLKQGKTSINNSIQTGFDVLGVFAGLGYTIPVKTIGAFNMTLMGVLSQATWKDTTGPDLDADISFGYSAGVTYSHNINDNLSASLEFKKQSYTYDFSSSFNLYSRTIEEDMQTLGVVVRYAF